MSQETIQTGIRMVGHLLEHHGKVLGVNVACDATGKAVDTSNRNATYWCATGACEVVAAQLQSVSYRDLDRVSAAIAKELGSYNNMDLWERSTPEKRAAFIQAHKEYVAP